MFPPARAIPFCFLSHSQMAVKDPSDLSPAPRPDFVLTVGEQILHPAVLCNERLETGPSGSGALTMPWRQFAWGRGISGDQMQPSGEYGSAKKETLLAVDGKGTTHLAAAGSHQSHLPSHPSADASHLTTFQKRGLCPFGLRQIMTLGRLQDATFPKVFLTEATPRYRFRAGRGARCQQKLTRIHPRKSTERCSSPVRSYLKAKTGWWPVAGCSRFWRRLCVY